MRRLFNARDRLGNQRPLPGIFPDGEAPIVRIGADGERELVNSRWGWSKAKWGWVTNARELGNWPWRTVIADVSSRCLVPATSFAEYHPSEKTEKGHKAAAWFRLKGEEARPPFAFAGFWRTWKPQQDGTRKQSEAGETAAFPVMVFLTTDPNAVVAPIHSKAMPVILTEEAHFETWLRGPAEEARKLQTPYPADAMDIAFIGEKEDSGAA